MNFWRMSSYGSHISSLSQGKKKSHFWGDISFIRLCGFVYLIIYCCFHYLKTIFSPDFPFYLVLPKCVIRVFTPHMNKIKLTRKCLAPPWAGKEGVSALSEPVELTSLTLGDIKMSPSSPFLSFHQDEKEFVKKIQGNNETLCTLLCVQEIKLAWTGWEGSFLLRTLTAKPFWL